MTQIRPDRIGQTLMLLNRDFHDRLAADLAQRNVQGISQRHRAVFLHLGQHGASRSVDLAASAGIRPQSMMTIVHELEAMGLVERRPDPADSRAKLIDFTRSGRRLIAELTRSTDAVFQQYADIIGEDNMRITFTQLERLLANSDAGE